MGDGGQPACKVPKGARTRVKRDPTRVARATNQRDATRRDAEGNAQTRRSATHGGDDGSFACGAVAVTWV